MEYELLYEGTKRVLTRETKVRGQQTWKNLQVADSKDDHARNGLSECQTRKDVVLQGDGKIMEIFSNGANPQCQRSLYNNFEKEMWNKALYRSANSPTDIVCTELSQIIKSVMLFASASLTYYLTCKTYAKF
jgi:hypothetical protein